LKLKFYLPVALTIAAAIGVAGCGVAHPVASAHIAAASTAAAVPEIVPSPSSAAPLRSAAEAPTTASVVRPHFATPQAAMTYLAAAYNRDDVAAIHYVTTPASFKALMAMRSEAVDLQLRSCTRTGRGDYLCLFRHRYPKHMHDKGYGVSQFIAAPAINPGWYMYQFLDCG
jgi:hypothetical protein